MAGDRRTFVQHLGLLLGGITCRTAAGHARHLDTRPAWMPKAWTYSRSLVAPVQRSDEPSFAQKDPSIVRVGKSWHLFMTAKLPTRSVVEYCRFEKWDEANEAARIILPLSESRYYCAPQVFFYRPHDRWYLIYQVGIPGRQKLQVAYSTTRDIDDPHSWTPARPILDGGPTDPRRQGGLDFWIIADRRRVHLFFTTLDGRMWRMWTTPEAFPRGFRNLQLALQGNFFEASHTYHLKGRNEYLTIIEAKGKRYYQAYLADRLEGPWRPVAASRATPFAGSSNVAPDDGVPPWTDNISHGELLRAAADERLLVDPSRLRMIFQGLRESDKKGLPYGRFPWKLGLLRPRT